MARWLLVVVLAAAPACTDWRSLYRARDAAASAPALPPDAAEELPVSADDAEAPPPPGDATPGGEPVPCDAPDTAPVVLWKFEGRGQPDPSQFVADSACRSPDVSLSWDLLRNPGKTFMGDSMLFLDGGFLLAAKKDSDDLGHAVVRARSFSIELWLRARHMVSGTVFTTNGEHEPGRAFSLSQKDSELHFTVHTTATDADGQKFTVAGASADLAVPLPVDTVGPVHVVAMYSRLDHTATVYVNGVLAGAVAHGPRSPAEAIPVWASMGKNQLGVGGSFDGAPWHGWLYRVAIYDRALAADEIATLARQPP
jgi:hypothetical protein